MLKGCSLPAGTAWSPCPAWSWVPGTWCMSSQTRLTVLLQQLCSLCVCLCVCAPISRHARQCQLQEALPWLHEKWQLASCQPRPVCAVVTCANLIMYLSSRRRDISVAVWLYVFFLWVCLKDGAAGCLSAFLMYQLPGKPQEAFSLFSVWHQTFFPNLFWFFSVTALGLVQQSSLEDIIIVLLLTLPKQL